MYDIVVVGGGPAGMTAALYALRNGKSVVVIEKEGFGGQITHSPKVENYPGYTSLSGNELADHMMAQIMEQGADIEIATVCGITPCEGGWSVQTDDGTAFEGSYCTVVFSIIDEKMTSSALHLTVNDLSDENAVTISCQTESAIVKYKGAPEEDDDSSYREVKLPLSKSPYTPEDMIASGDIVNVEIDNEDILTYADGKFTASAAGTAKVTIEYADGSVAKLMVIIEDDTSSSVAETTTVTTAAPGTEEKEESSNSLMFILIAVVVVIGIGIVIAEYFLIMKRRDPNDDEYDEYPEEEASEATNEGGVIRSGYDPNDQNPDAGYDDEYYDDEEYYDDDQPAPDDNTQNKDE